jgi:hypothetical protein
MGTKSFLGVKRPGCGVDHPSHIVDVKERTELYLYFSSGPSWPINFTFIFTFTFTFAFAFAFAFAVSFAQRFV